LGELAVADHGVISIPAIVVASDWNALKPACGTDVLFVVMSLRNVSMLPLGLWPLMRLL